jgi:hypothetical protein
MSFPLDLILVPEVDEVHASLEAAVQAMDLLSTLAVEGGAKPLEEFISEDATLGDGEEISASQLHDPADGLRSVQVILSKYEGSEEAEEEVIAELVNLREALSAAAKAGSKFCFSMDL